ncbi:MAG: ATP-dependent zinc metalloprotease FtsH [Firmicutes bacterium ADurb.Bin193]|nr:MAG: ATP-dependent zinc metalloprotease FtsH [Firmicutes bacterium ADurb.Bin193]
MNKHVKSISFYILLFAVILLIFGLYAVRPLTPPKLYSDLYREIKNGNVSKLVIVEQMATATLKDSNNNIEVTVPPIMVFYEDLGEDIRKQVEAGSLKFDIQPPVTAPWWVTILPTLILVVVFVIFWVFFLQQSQGGGGGKVMQFGKSKAKMINEGNKKYTFKDVAGADEEKEELEEIVEFLKMPKKFIELGARIPRGVLLVGPPGTGKTLLAKAVAGEAGVPFFSISGSDFVEMFVGVGASRVRDLFEQAKKNSPSIVFIDEIDAVGRHRGAGLGGGHDEREQTLNQLLVEMDGFGDNQGVIIIAATNRPDILDPALLRPGRFDRQVVVGVPDVKGREEILKVHTNKKPLGDDVDLTVLAKTTAGFTGADLENLSNEAALLSARREKAVINMKEFEDAIIKVIAGPEKKTRVIMDKERKITGYHEAGHAVITKLLPTQDPVHQVSIVPRGRAGGYTLSLPKEDKYYVSKTEMNENIITLLGGRVAEKLVLDDISTGASNDIERATAIARNMVVKYGMSETLGPITFGSPHDEVFIGKDYAQTRNYSENIAARIDNEIKLIIDSAYNRCAELLSENMEKLHAVANALLEKEKISAEEFEEIFASA